MINITEGDISEVHYVYKQINRVILTNDELTQEIEDLRKRVYELEYINYTRSV